MMWTGFNWLRLVSLTGSRERWNNLQATSVQGICWSIERLSTPQNGKWSKMYILLLMCCERLAYHTCCLMNKVVDFVFRHLSTTQWNGGKLREREREREKYWEPNYPARECSFMVSTKRGRLCMITQTFCGTYFKTMLPSPQLYKDLRVA